VGREALASREYGEVARGWGISGFVRFSIMVREKRVGARGGSCKRRTAQTMSCTISELIALTRRARLFIGGDTGPLHLAAALRVPVVAIYGPTDPARNGPYGRGACVAESGERYIACAAGGGG